MKVSVPRNQWWWKGSILVVAVGLFGHPATVSSRFRPDEVARANLKYPLVEVQKKVLGWKGQRALRLEQKKVQSAGIESKVDSIIKRYAEVAKTYEARRTHIAWDARAAAASRVGVSLSFLASFADTPVTKIVCALGLTIAGTGIVFSHVDNVLDRTARAMAVEDSLAEAYKRGELDAVASARDIEDVSKYLRRPIRYPDKTPPQLPPAPEPIEPVYSSARERSHDRRASSRAEQPMVMMPMMGMGVSPFPVAVPYFGSGDTHGKKRNLWD